MVCLRYISVNTLHGGKNDDDDDDDNVMATVTVVIKMEVQKYAVVHPLSSAQELTSCFQLTYFLVSQ
jgi:hypothetical protein